MGLILYNLFLILYRIGIGIAAPWNPKARLWIDGRERFPEINAGERTIWMHCSSLGEFEQGRPVLESIRNKYPSYKIVLSFFSPSGYEIRKNYAGADQVIYLPMDSKANAAKLIASIKPSLVIWVKYEYWYYYLNTLQKKNIPVILVSGIFRESQPFFRWYGGLWRTMLSSFSQFFVQEEHSKKLLEQAGIKDGVTVAGDTRFDRVVEIAEKQESLPLIEHFIQHHPVLVAGSTWEEDEEELVHYVKKHPNTRFIIAPHEIDDERISEIRNTFHDVILYSALSKEMAIPNHINVLVIDNIGMLSKLYRYADVCYVGGGFGNDGIHNILEAAVYGKPVVFGPVYEKFLEARELVNLEGAFSVEQALELESLLDELMTDENKRKNSGDACRDYVYRRRGATKKILDYVNEKRLLTN